MTENERQTRTHAAPVVRVVRSALGRDPDIHEMRDLADRSRHGASVPDLAEAVAASEAFARIHGADGAPDAAFVARVQAFALGGAATDLIAATLAAMAAMGASRAQIVATLADSPAGHRTIPLLPGMVPGARPDDPLAYRLWVNEYDDPAAEELSRLPAIAGPSIAVAMTAGDTTAEAAIRSIESLRGQVYPGWTIHLSAHLLSAWPRRALLRLAATEPRLILVDDMDRVASRARASDHALSSGDAQLICLLDAGDVLAPTALYEIVCAYAADPDIALLYTDEDRIDGQARSAPRFKPAHAPGAMLAGNAIGQLAVYRRALLERVGGPRPTASTGELHDLAGRACAILDQRQIRHYPAVLIHRANPDRDWPAPSRETEIPPGPRPLASVIVLTRDRAPLLAACARGVLERTDYENLELLVVDNGSREPSALELLATLEATPRVRVLRRPAPFNFAALNNAASAEAAGEVLVLLNNDIEVLEPNWLRALVAMAMRPDVGAVGAKLLYPDRTLQHGGILLGPAGAATHVGRHLPADAPGYGGQLAVTRDLSAVTGACLAIRNEVFLRVGGMDERLAVTWNDIDLCLRVRERGLRVVWTPLAVLTHREGETRGRDADDPASEARFRAEQAIVRDRWGDAIDRDPFLNPNLLAGLSGDMLLAKPRHPRPWAKVAPR